MVEMTEMRDYKLDHTKITAAMKKRGWTTGVLLHWINSVRMARGQTTMASDSNLRRVISGKATFTHGWHRDIVAATDENPEYFYSYGEHGD